MKISVYNQKGEKVKDLTLSSNFSLSLNPKLLTLYINYLRSATRYAIANTKDRSEVSGGGKKPWRQKGTGNARVGSTRSPLWVGGGVTFGPTSNQNFKKRINSVAKKNAILGIFSELFKDKKVAIVENLKLNTVKTNSAAEILNNLKLTGKLSIILSNNDENARLSFRNIEGIKIMSANKLDMLHILSSDNIILSENSLSEIENIYTPKKKIKEENA